MKCHDHREIGQQCPVSFLRPEHIDTDRSAGVRGEKGGVPAVVDMAEEMIYNMITRKFVVFSAGDKLKRRRISCEKMGV